MRAIGLAILAHAALVMALTWGVSWKHQSVAVVAEAELWAQVPVEAAPRVEEPLPPPPATPPVPVAETAAKVPEPPKVEEPDIVTQREKQRLADEKHLQDEKLEKEKARKLEAQQKLDAQKLADAKKQKQLLEAKAAKEAQELAQQEARRQENIKRAAGLAGATGGPTAGGAALQSSGPSASYAGRIRARIKPNIVFTGDISGNPTAEVEVHTTPDGTIIRNKIRVKPSGSPAWDEAVLKAIEKTEVLPRDVDGHVPTPLVISFRPKD